MKDDIPMNGLIVCSGEIKDYSYYKDMAGRADLIICVDGGAHHMVKLGVKPHILIGDFDSIDEKDYNYYKELGTEILKFPVEKDETDTELAVLYAINSGCTEITLIGAIGSRVDHTLANISLLKRMLDAGVKGWIINENNSITLIKDHILLSRKRNEEKVSLMPFTEKVEGITTKGLYYPLHNATMNAGITRGISNEFTGDTAEVTIKSGLLLVMITRDNM